VSHFVAILIFSFVAGFSMGLVGIKFPAPQYWVVYILVCAGYALGKFGP
jgi:hypothetical protein